MGSFKHRFPNFLLFITLVFFPLLMSSSCKDNNSVSSSEDDELDEARVVIEPENASFEYTNEQDFSAYVISASDDTVNEDFNLNWNWYSSDPNVFTVQNNGAAKGQNPGEAYCIVEASTESGKIAAKLRFTGRDSAFVRIF